MPLLGEKVVSAKANKAAVSKGYFSLGYLLVVILCANDFLSLGEWTHVAGKFNIRDIGNALIMVGVIVMLPKRSRDPALWTPMSLLILLYLFMLSIHVAIASLLYDQSITQGILSARHQFYYLSFFLFLLVLDTPLKVVRFLNMLTLLALLVVVLGVINYFGHTIFSHKWAEGHGERAGLTRAFLPAMNVLGAAALWEFSKYAEKWKIANGGITGMVLFAAHVFRQTRMRTVGLVAVVLFMLVQRRRWGAFVLVLAIGVMGTTILEIGFDKPVITSQFTTAISDVEEGEGTWRGRVIQLETAIDAFMEHPVMGTGAAVLRSQEAASSLDEYRELAQLQSKADLGYAVWLKSYGSLGIAWLLAFYMLWWKSVVKARRNIEPHMSDVSSFSTALLLWLAGTFVTLNHFMYVGGIIIVCAGAAVAIRISTFKREQFS